MSENKTPDWNSPEWQDAFRRFNARPSDKVTGGSQAHEAEALLKGQPHEAEEKARTSTALHEMRQSNNTQTNLPEVSETRGSAAEVGGSDTARLQQIREQIADRIGGLGVEGAKHLKSWDDCDGHDRGPDQECDACDEIFGLAAFLSDILNAWDAQALALRAVREERDDIKLQREDLADEIMRQHDELTSLRADVERLTSERDEARVDVVRMATTKVGEKCEHHRQPLEVIERLALRECPICWKVCAEHAEQQVRALRTSIEQLEEARNARVQHATNQAGDLRGTDLGAYWQGRRDEAEGNTLLALLAAIKEP